MNSIMNEIFIEVQVKRRLNSLVNEIRTFTTNYFSLLILKHKTPLLD